MSESDPSRDSIRQLAGRVATTDHAALDDETIYEVIDVIRDLDGRIQESGSADAVRDLVTFWKGYVTAGLHGDASRDAGVDDWTDLPELFERGNAADLYGLDLYQGLLQLAKSFDADSDDGDVSDRTARWAERVSALTRDFVEHLEDHV